MKRLALMLFVLLSCAVQAQTTYYVNNRVGSDNNPGTSPTYPKLTIQLAVDAASSGDSISVAGTDSLYDELVTFFGKTLIVSPDWRKPHVKQFRVNLFNLASNVISFTGDFLVDTLELLSGRVEGSNLLSLSDKGKIIRWSSQALVAQQVKYEGEIDLEYRGLSDIPLGLEAPAESLRILRNLTISFEQLDPTPKLLLNRSLYAENATFNNGLVLTGENNSLVLRRPAPSAAQGFWRNVATGGKSHVVGNVRQNLVTSNILAFAAHDFPVGDTVNYRPVSLTFFNANAGGTLDLGVSTTVSHTNARPTGVVGLPITQGIDASTDLSRYPSFFWSISTDASLGAAPFNLGLTAAGYSSTEIDVNDVALNRVKIIRRSGGPDDQANQWVLQGTNYDNFVISGVPTVVNVNSTGGLNPEGAIFTYGIGRGDPIGNLFIIPTLTDASPVFRRSLKSPAVFAGNKGALGFSVSVANSAIATASIINNDTLRVIGKATGTTSLTVTAVDSADGSRISYTTSTECSFSAGNRLRIVADPFTIPTLADENPVFRRSLISPALVTGTVGALSFTVLLDSTSIAMARMRNDTLEVIGKMNGVTTLRITATDAADSSQVTYSLSVVCFFSSGKRLMIANPINDIVYDCSSVIFKRSLINPTYFTGNVGALEFSAYSLNASVVTVEIKNNDTLVISIHVFGTTYVSVAATDVDGERISHSFTVSPHPHILRDEPPFRMLWLSSKNIYFGAARVGESKDTILKIWDYPTWRVQISNIATIDSNFGVSKTSGFIPLCSPFETTVRFLPRRAGLISASLVVLSNAVSSPDTIMLSGIGDPAVRVNDEQLLPTEFALGQNYPNPFNSQTSFEFQVPSSVFVALKVYDVLGRDIATLVNEVKQPGVYKVTWDASQLLSGVYVYRMLAGSFVAVKKLVLLR